MKLIKMPSNIKEQAIEDFDKQYQEARAKFLASDRITQSFKFEFEPPTDLTVPEELKNTLRRPRIAMSAGTYLKMLQYVLKIEVECAWHGFVTRHPNNVFAIIDVKMYPHKGSGAYVESDDTKLTNHTVTTDGIDVTYPTIEKYEAWKLGLTTQEELTLRFQAHSHVNMSVGPSGTDLQNQKDFMNDIINFIETNPNATPEQLNAFNPFYIFAIMNKRQEINWFIYDYTVGVLFEKEDIDFVIVWKDDYTMIELEQEIKEMPTTRTTYYNNTRYYNTDLDDDTPTWPRWPESKDKIWEIKCTSENAHSIWIKCEFYLKHKDLLFAHKDPNVNYYFYYAIDDTAAKKIPFEEFRKTSLYSTTAGLILMEIDRPKWYPPKNQLTIIKPEKKTKRLEKCWLKLDEWDQKGETPYILVDTKRDKFNEIDAQFKHMMDMIGEFTDITFKNNEVKLCFCITKLELIEDEQLECIIALQNAGFSLRSVLLEKHTLS